MKKSESNPGSYDLIVITNLPAFYKILLFNRIALHRRILVLYTGHGADGRNADFYKGTPAFEWRQLKGSNPSKCLEVARILRRNKYRELLLCGWDHPALWVGAFLSPKRLNSLCSESSACESQTSGLKGGLKCLFVSRISRGYFPGKAQKEVLDKLGFSGESLITKGVGIFNYGPRRPFEERTRIKKFLYVGRFVEQKNLKLLIRAFNRRSDLELYMVGFGVQEEELRQMAGDNIHFTGAIDNDRLADIYSSMDVFVLPSASEPWGLVVEEALSCGLPVIVSDRVGCHREIVGSRHGLIFPFDSEEALLSAVDRMRDLKFYNQLQRNVSQLDFEAIAADQVAKYLH